MRLILIGPPGSGKGTQAHWISQHYHLPHLSTGDMIRSVISQSSVLGKALSHQIEQGKLISDSQIIELIKSRITQPDCYQGFILDGFPRTVTQMEQLNALTSIDIVIEFVVSMPIIIERFSGRRIHPPSGRIYHVQYSPPRIDGRDDLTGEPLIQRTDDNEDTIRKRLEIYYQYTQPVSHYYQQWAKRSDHQAPTYYVISASQSIQQIHQEVQACLKNH